MLWSGRQAISQTGPGPSHRPTWWIMNASALAIQAALSTAGSLNVAAKRCGSMLPGSLTLDEPDMMAQASRAGIGLAYVGEWLVADEIASGSLIEVLSEWTPSYPGYCLYYPGRRTWPRACAPSSIWPMRFSFGI